MLSPGEYSTKNTGESLKRFGPFTLDIKGGRLLRAGTRVRIQPQPLRVLALLAGHPGDLVTRQQIRRAIWGDDVHVDFEQALNYAIRQVRHALQDTAPAPKYIETVPKLGYRFVADVDECDAPGPDTRTSVSRSESALPPAESPDALERNPELAPTPPELLPVLPGAAQTGARRRWIAAGAALFCVIAFGWVLSARFASRRASLPISIAVLPIVNLTGDTETDTLADGMTEELIAQLSMLSGDLMRVTARTSAMYYKGRPATARSIATELHVSYVIESSVRKDSKNLRLTSQLIRGSDEGHVWTYVTVTNPDNVYRAQRDIAARVIQRLCGDRALSLGAEKRALPLPVAADHYLRGEHFLWLRTRHSLLSALEEFKTATATDPSFARAYADEAIAYGLLGQYGWIQPAKAALEAKAAVARALSLDDSLPDGYAARAFCHWFYDWNWKDAEQDFQHAIRLDPSNSNALQWYSLFLATRQDPQGARYWMDRALAVDPKSQILRTNRGWIEFLAGNAPEAARRMEKVLQEDPGFLSARRKLWMVYSFEHRDKEAFDQLRYLFPYTVPPEDQQSILHALSVHGYRAAMQCWLDARDGVAFGNAVGRAEIAVLSGNPDRALAFLAEGLRTHDGWMVFARVDPILQQLNRFPQYQQITTRVSGRSN